ADLRAPIDGPALRRSARPAAADRRRLAQGFRRRHARSRSHLRMSAHQHGDQLRQRRGDPDADRPALFLSQERAGARPEDRRAITRPASETHLDAPLAEPRQHRRIVRSHTLGSPSRARRVAGYTTLQIAAFSVRCVAMCDWSGFGRVLLASILSCFVWAAGARAETCLADASAVPQAIEDQPLDSAALADFYTAVEGACVWRASDAAALLQAIDALPLHAIDPAPFHPALIRARLLARDEAAQAETDLLLTDAALRYARAMTAGLVPPGRVDEDWDFPQPELDHAAALRTALAEQTLGAWLASLPPADPAYRGL